jgi:ferric-dicitrate binding protein FerR (iron transport regulator)
MLATLSARRAQEAPATALRERHFERREIMRSIASALLALALLAGIAGQVSAFDAETFFEDQKKNLP